MTQHARWVCAAITVLACARSVSSAETPPPDFARDVQSILAERCQMCHDNSNRSGKLSVASRQALLEGGASGPAVRPGDPSRSLLVNVITGDKPRMPKFGNPLTRDQIQTITRWIAAGAPGNEGAAAKPEQWWSLEPLRKPAVPGGNARNPIDAFIRQRLGAAGLTPSQEADRRTLARRLYFDLHGLPPTPEQIVAFVNDPAPDAYEKLVDALLASPRYGERWARHWLDVVHYGESHGYDKDKPRLNAWPYRDYVIDAFNSDKPYARFVREQIAGDVLFPRDPRAFVATGFLAAGPWDFVGHQELRESTTEKDNTRLLDRDDMVATTISTFVSMTAHCARCHNHKFDPIPQADYYNLQSVFAGIDRADRPYDEDPEVHFRRQQLLAEKRRVQRKLQPVLDKVEFATSPAIADLDVSIQDASLLIAHIGDPKTPADAERKKQLQARLATDRASRQRLVDAIVGPETYAAIETIKNEFKPIDAELAALPKPKLVYSGAAYFNRAGTFRPSLEPRPVHVLARGSVQAPGAVALPGALSCVAGLAPRFELADSSDEGARRAALAEWIASSGNALTWRSIVNRVWHYHFGNGIVDSPNDFGRMGGKPSHPELLDWLAVWFRDDAKGSMKALHRLIVTSATYQQSSANREDGARVDADNRLLWRMNRGRLDAESIRDAVLSVAGKLDFTMGGPSVQMFWFKDDHSPVYDYARFSPDAPGAYRRSIYRFIVRSVPDPFMERLDCPDPSVLTPKRSTTITAIQALVLLNDPFMVRMSQHLSARVRSVPELTRVLFGRDPSASEVDQFTAYARKHGMENLCRILFNANEFAFVD